MVTGDDEGLAGRQADNTGGGSGRGKISRRRTTDKETMEEGAMESEGLMTPGGQPMVSEQVEVEPKAETESR